MSEDEKGLQDDGAAEAIEIPADAGESVAEDVLPTTEPTESE